MRPLVLVALASSIAAALAGGASADAPIQPEAGPRRVMRLTQEPPTIAHVLVAVRSFGPPGSRAP